MSEDRELAEGEEPSESYDASDPRHVSKAKREARLREQHRQNFFSRMVADAEARKICWDILSDLRVFEQRFAEPSTPAHAESAWFLMGQREGGLKLFRLLLRYQPALTAQMMAENDRG